ncbi:glycosyltransferase family 2 protein [Pseudosulfitobacter pseudonitzschiae]|uniref:glycosyltransferase family 2 protein n=1 Tax=Pseudosulfitobacter pseudonitzschiae TaxID=1402135 RepID=UPI001CCC3733|nr:glycosyltransferase family 2 protein [Pseudosulfitobacter pseudonitzschiae]MCA0136039.1 glycosyltransferase family 2 protein [Pseudosulfitobacter pseudonitzschiae]MCD2327611.1 glycosyltransferase family 2 protein [Pseudosulfitobacter pseudonitzschiae]MCD2352051.1 glycosyltransferase family 2 protein [Pseudosulfitobacter pseudonitzschiae]MCI2214684.1 glycosyltransferase family 2 protein [Pseudosulfitobacter pseudonitzschiae]UFE30593.1 glycosyltransferase family 2 protein [Pseudosulfitobacter
MRLQRKRWRIRAFRKRRELTRIADRTSTIRPDDILLFSTQRNEKIRLPYFLDYYREQGVNHFFIVDNDSTDGSADYLADQPDVSVWQTKASYKKSRFGVDWLNWLMIKHAHGHWCLTVDPDEFLIYPFCDTRPLRALTDWLDASSIKSFSAMLLDMYPKGRLDAHPYQQGQNPIEIAGWFDSGNYTMSRNRLFGNLWIQGGPRARVFFADQPENAPALNKVPLVKWDKRYAYVSSTHMLLPRGLNQVYDEWGGEKASGVLLHAKFLDTFTSKAAEELSRGQHYSASVEYKAYAESLKDDPDLWCKWSEKYINWRQLEILGLMSKGNWA